MEDRLIELEALQKALLKGLEAYDKMPSELVKAKQSLTKIFTSKDVEATEAEVKPKPRAKRYEVNNTFIRYYVQSLAYYYVTADRLPVQVCAAAALLLCTAASAVIETIFVFEEEE